jgi:hypothetical protein
MAIDTRAIAELEAVDFTHIDARCAVDALDARIGDAQTLAPTEELGKVQFLPTSWRGLL